ncbi:hypothetical protein RCC89_15650 [Cytophagaceae bacterium ABcell3]|nr:hypothetical protein RCC89_15650 [Cytophagaceae bacterium ABcell3]
MSIHLYQSQKVQRYIGKGVYDDLPWAEDQVDPLTLWYADVFFIRRERYLVIANPLTKFTFFVFRYNKKTHPDFMETFKERLSFTMKAAEIDPSKYLEQCDMLVPFEKPDRSASAHLSRIKTDYKDSIEYNKRGVHPSEAESVYNTHIVDYLTTYNKKDYDYVKRRFYHELLLRRWA